MPLAVFRADASPQIGGGHIQRCLSLAGPMSANGWRCAFAVREPTPATVPGLDGAGHDLIVLRGAVESEAQELKAGLPSDCDLLVVDHYERGAEYETACRAFAHQVMVFDDWPHRAHDCDILLDAMPSRTADEYRPFVPPSCRVLAGGRYAILRPKFLAARADALARRQSAARPERILVSVGMTDPGNLTAMVLEGIARSGVPSAVDVVLGSAAPHARRVRELIAQGGEHATRLHVDAANMAELMRAADVAIGAAGTSSFERCCLGLPGVTLQVADNQRDIAAALAEAGASLVLAGDKINAQSIAAAIAGLWNDADRLAAMSAASAGLCDGRGTGRVLAALAGAVAAKDGCAVTLRLAEQDDSARLLAWQRQPNTRRFSHHPQAPGEDEHARWFAAVTADPSRLLFIVARDGEPTGMLRLDATGPGVHRVSILTAPDHYRRGLAGAALALARRVIPAGELQAEVLAENDASHALFRGAGYRQRIPGLYVHTDLNNERDAIHRH